MIEEWEGKKTTFSMNVHSVFSASQNMQFIVEF